MAEPHLTEPAQNKCHPDSPSSAAPRQVGLGNRAIEYVTGIGANQCLMIQVDIGVTFGAVPMVWKWTCR